MSLTLSLGLALASATAAEEAQKDTFLSPPETDCGTDSAYPIAGTAGYANAITALRTNAVTYSAATFAERSLFRDIAPSAYGKAHFGFGWDLHITHHAADVLVFQEDAHPGAPGITDTNRCPNDLITNARSVDLQAENLGFAFRKGPVGLFYASSVTFGQISETNPALRAMMWDFAWPMYSIMALMAAPLTGAGYHTSTGASAFAIDWIGGGTLDAKWVDANVGYTGSRGLYASAHERLLGAYGNFVWKGQFTSWNAGLDRVRYGGASDSVGMTSMFGRGLPISEPVPSPDAPTLAERVQLLRTGHFQQDAIAGILDLHAAVSWTPEVALHEGAIGIHNKGWVQARGTPPEEAMGGGLLQVGTSHLPEQFYYGLPSKQVFTLRAEFGALAPTTETAAMSMAMRVLVNDPEQLALYPFARNALSVDLSTRASF